jgi:uncharacterized protein Smg (DUF494 family)
MYDKIVEILIYLLLEIKEKQSLNDIDLSKLEESGYSPLEISAALSWLFEKMRFNETQLPSHVSADSSRSFRIFHDVEKLAIDAQARGFLMQLRELNLVTEIELEYVIERIMLSGYSRANIEDVKAIVSSVFFEMKDPSLYGTSNKIFDSGTIH